MQDVVALLHIDNRCGAVLSGCVEGGGLAVREGAAGGGKERSGRGRSSGMRLYLLDPGVEPTLEFIGEDQRGAGDAHGQQVETEGQAHPEVDLEKHLAQCGLAGLVQEPVERAHG
ncbi:MAG: hypothetical protein QM757_47035 [Paludibaculum sp.]